jgi:hypothetical protein
MQNATSHTTARVLTALLTFSLIAALLVKAGSLSLEAMVGWQILLGLIGGLSVVIGHRGGGGGPGRPILAQAFSRRR